MPSSPQWVFGPFRLDPDHACLWCEAQALPLPPKAFAVLHYLVTHPDRLVTKEELLEAVWPETAVTDAVVRVAIAALRKVLGDTTQTPQYITTVPRRGYRFLASVAEHTDAVPSPARLATPAVFQAPVVEPLNQADSAPPQGIAALPGALPAREAERRFLTVVFCDLVDAATLTADLDPEDLREVIHAYYQTCAEVVQRFDGYLAHYRGDDVLAYFGYPVAHEDDAQRAIHTRLGILDALAALNPQLALSPGEQLAVRLGVHTGLVVAGDDVGAGARHEPLAVGQTHNIAWWLRQLAAPNTLVISAATY